MTTGTPRPVRIAASILAADFARLGEQVAEAEAAGCDWLHVDVMDGHFVPNISLGLPVIEALRRSTRLPLDVHLMIEQPERFITAFAAAGADHLIIHVEACRHLHRAVEQIRAAGLSPGVTLNPATPLVMVEGLLPHVDQVVIMSVNPGFGGQQFIPSSLSRLAALRRRLTEAGLNVLISIDGGVNPDNAGQAVLAGADVLVAGTAVFGRGHTVAAGVAALRRAAAQVGQDRL
jgi:ribulose-phosphate 3-epimerase